MSMTMRPFYRWRGFWLGVLVVAFLGWAWVRSQEMYSYVSVSRAGGWGVGMGQERGEISVGFLSVGDGGFYHVEGIQQGGVRWWADAWRKGTNDSALYVWVGHWVVMLSFVVVWVGWLAWRWRRGKRAC